MRKLCAVLLGLIVAVGAAGCSALDRKGSDGSLVVVSTNILGDVVSNLVDDKTKVKVLMPRNADPHSFEISASDAAEVERADLFVSNGLGLEEGIAKTADAARKEGVPLLEVGEKVDPIAYRTGKSTGAHDPHFWTDPDRMIRAVKLIRDAVLDKVSGVDAPAVRGKAERYEAELRDIAGFMQKEFDAIPADRKKLVTNHHVFGYLALRFGFEVVGAVVPSGSTLASPSASDLASLASAIRQAGVGAIFVDSSQPDRLARVLASEAKIPVKVSSLHTESLGEKGTEAGTYLGMMRSNATKIAAGLR